eukprot:14663-Prymnesium_polylepis.4
MVHSGVGSTPPREVGRNPRWGCVLQGSCATEIEEESLPFRALPEEQISICCGARVVCDVAMAFVKRVPKDGHVVVNARRPQLVIGANMCSVQTACPQLQMVEDSSIGFDWVVRRAPTRIDADAKVDTALGAGRHIVAGHDTEAFSHHVPIYIDAQPSILGAPRHGEVPPPSQLIEPIVGFVPIERLEPFGRRWRQECDRKAPEWSRVNTKTVAPCREREASRPPENVWTELSAGDIGAAAIEGECMPSCTPSRRGDCPTSVNQGEQARRPVAA